MVTCKVGGGKLNIRKLGKYGNLQIAIKVAGSIGSHLELLKMTDNQNRKFDVLGIL